MRTKPLAAQMNSVEPAHQVDDDVTWRRRRGATGQAIVEFCLVLTIMLGLTLCVLDFSRVFFQYIDVQSATRTAVEYVATNSNSGTAVSDASKRVCAALTGSQSFTTVGSSGAKCTVNPAVVITVALTAQTTAPYTAKNPLMTGHIVVSMPFSTVIPWKQWGLVGTWTVGASEYYSVIQGRT